MQQERGFAREQWKNFPRQPRAAWSRAARAHRRAAVTALSLAGCLPALLRADDWPQWGGRDLGRNMVSKETGLPDGFRPGERSPSGEGLAPGSTENVRWMVELGSYIFGNPTITGGRIFAGTDDTGLRGDDRFHQSKGGMVQCLDEKTGQLIWRLVIPNRPEERLPEGAHYGQQHFGTCSSPAVDGKRVFVLTSSCEVLCLDVNGLADGNDGPFTAEGQYMVGPGKPPLPLAETDADILWKRDLVEELGVCPHDVASCSLLIDGRFVYTETSNGVDRPHDKCLRPEAPSFICLDAETGRLLAADDEKMGRRMWHCLWAPPSMGLVNGKKLVFFGGADGYCYAFEALTQVPEQTVTFKKVWQYDCNPPHYRLRNGQPIPYYEGDKRKSYSTNKDDGKFLGPSEVISTPVFYQNRLYVTIGQDPMHGRGRGLLHCIDATQSGDITHSGCIWSYDDLERTISSVAIADGLLYAVDLPGRVHCLDLATGKLRWVFELKGETWGTPLVADGKLFIGTKKKFFVLATGPKPGKLAEISLGSPSYGTPVAANGTVYVASQRRLWAVQKGAQLRPEFAVRAGGSSGGGH